jgi:hypothetical protein
MKLWNKLNHWLDWRGIRWVDILGASLALGTIVALSIMLIWAGLQ